eukprot:Gb_39834 [translate_table: standard]
MRPVFCGNFEYDTRQSDLERMFSRYGRVERVDMKSGIGSLASKNVIFQFPDDWSSLVLPLRMRLCLFQCSVIAQGFNLYEVTLEHQLLVSFNKVDIANGILHFPHEIITFHPSHDHIVQVSSFQAWHMEDSMIHHHCFAFVYMDDERDAEDAIRGLDNTEFGRQRRRLSVEWARQGDRVIRHREGSMRSAANLKPTKTLFVINFDPFSTRVRDLERHFEPYGKLLHVRIRRNFAFVQYETQEEATKALECTNMSKVLDRVISVEYAARDDGDRNGRRESPGRRGGYGRRAERGSPSYGRSVSPIYGKRAARPSPDYGRAPSPAYDRYRGPVHERNRSPVYDRNIIAKLLHWFWHKCPWGHIGRPPFPCVNVQAWAGHGVDS